MLGVADITAAVHRYAADPTTLLSLPRVVQAWGTKTSVPR